METVNVVEDKAHASKIIIRIKNIADGDEEWEKLKIISRV